MTTKLGFMRLMEEYGAYQWGLGTQDDRALVKSEDNFDNVEVRLQSDGRCTVDAALEFYMKSGDKEYGKLLEERLYDGTDWGDSKSDVTRRLERASNSALKVIFKKKLSEIDPDIEKRFRCRVDDVHLHHEMIGSSEEHVHVACREHLPCPEAFKAASALVAASQLMKREKR